MTNTKQIDWLAFCERTKQLGTLPPTGELAQFNMPFGTWFELVAKGVEGVPLMQWCDKVITHYKQKGQ